MTNLPFPGDNAALMHWICAQTGAQSATLDEHIQSLWSGYGEILRVGLTGADHASVVVKKVTPPTRARHPRGWNSNRSHQRKLHSYQVEMAWYSGRAAHCGNSARLPACLGSQADEQGWLFLLEDLDAAGYAGRQATLSGPQLDACLHWLAQFHAITMGVEATELWSVGTYWHLATRPDELAAIADPRLRAAAPLLDQRLNQCRYRSLVHGDAKVANFCFATASPEVAAVDFQYVGGGCGMKDVAYFLSSCMSEEECEVHALDRLDDYFDHLRTALHQHRPTAPAEAIESEWRSLYRVAWADFYRFLAGWSPDHWKINRYCDRLTGQVVDELLG